MMLKRALIAAMALAVVASLSPLSAFAKDDAKTAKQPTMKTSDTKPMLAERTKPNPMETPVANAIAVCGCGKVFMTDAHTPYFEYNGKRYACCSEECYKMAEAHPEEAAKMADANITKLMTQVKAEKSDNAGMSNDPSKMPHAK